MERHEVLEMMTTLKLAGSPCFLAVHVYHVESGKPVAVLLRPGKSAAGVEVRTLPSSFIQHPSARARWFGLRRRRRRPWNRSILRVARFVRTWCTFGSR